MGHSLGQTPPYWAERTGFQGFPTPTRLGLFAGPSCRSGRQTARFTRERSQVRNPPRPSSERPANRRSPRLCESRRSRPRNSCASTARCATAPGRQRTLRLGVQPRPGLRRRHLGHRPDLHARHRASADRRRRQHPRPARSATSAGCGSMTTTCATPLKTTANALPPTAPTTPKPPPATSDSATTCVP